jgi:regulator of protease activity HflC (stomatin/prohibitin superfamily)
VLRFGIVVRQLKPGFNWLIPFGIERALTANTAVHTIVVGPPSLMTKDNKPVVITTVISCTVESAEDFILKINGGVQTLEDAATGVISDMVMSKTFEELTTMKLAHELSKDVRAFAKPWGVYVRQVQISDFTTMKSFRLLQSQNHYHRRRKSFSTY